MDQESYRFYNEAASSRDFSRKFLLETKNELAKLVDV